MIDYHVEDLAALTRRPDQDATVTKAQLRSERLNELGAEGWNLTSVDGDGFAYLWRSRGYSAGFRAHLRQMGQQP